MTTKNNDVAKPDAYGFIDNLNGCSFAHRYNGETSMGELAIIAPEGCKIGLTMPDKIVNAVNSYEALLSVAKAAAQYRAAATDETDLALSEALAALNPQVKGE